MNRDSTAAAPRAPAIFADRTLRSRRLGAGRVEFIPANDQARSISIHSARPRQSCSGGTCAVLGGGARWLRGPSVRRRRDRQAGRAGSHSRDRSMRHPRRPDVRCVLPRSDDADGEQADRAPRHLDTGPTAGTRSSGIARRVDRPRVRPSHLDA